MKHKLAQAGEGGPKNIDDTKKRLAQMAEAG